MPVLRSGNVVEHRAARLLRDLLGVTCALLKLCDHRLKATVSLLLLLKLPARVMRLELRRVGLPLQCLTLGDGIRERRLDAVESVHTSASDCAAN